MRFYTTQHRFYCGIDLHARSLYVCIIDQTGDVLLHKKLSADGQHFLEAIKPYQESIVVGVECVFLWYWIADLCEEKGIPFVLGHALYMKAIHGGKAKNDKVDSEKLARMLRGGTFPVAYAYPQKMRADRDLLRRRNYLVRKRSELLGHIQNTNSQYNLPPIGLSLDVKRDREDVAKHFPIPAVRKSVEVDLKLLDHLDVIVADLERHIERTVKIHNPMKYYLLRTIDGVGKILSMVILYEIDDINRFPRVQDFCSYARLVKCAKESAGKKHGTGGRKIGNVHLKWAFSEAAVLFLRCNPRGQLYLKQVEKKHGKGKALSILAARLGRAAYFMLRRGEAFDRDKFYAA
ncbi:MAG: IS110 family transposase [Candidatus Aureabacteria bacterium]|nr:IS110 family transposase [Candidatus Auribacterota bacterium]